MKVNIEDINKLKELKISIKSEAYVQGVPNFIIKHPNNYIFFLDEIHRILLIENHKPNFEEIKFEKINKSYIMNLLLLHREWFPVNYQRDYFEKFFDDKKKYSTIGAFITINNKKYLIGSILYEICKQTNFRNNIPNILYEQSIIDYLCTNKKCAYINTIGVIDEYRKLKVASKLIELMIEDLKNKNIIAIYLHVILHNISAIKFYEKIKWEYSGIIENHYDINERHFDAKVFYYIINENYLKKNYTKIKNSKDTSSRNCIQILYKKIINYFNKNNKKYNLINQSDLKKI
jgi:ribosomal protein S18 acetylase RimI-like enzyme